MLNSFFIINPFQIFELPSEFSTIPAQAIECTIITGSDEQVPNSEELKIEVLDKDVILDVINIDQLR